MKLLLDANLSPRTRAYLTEMFHTDGVDGKLGEYSDKSDPMIGNWAE
jgi:predicted nuclease of predicted toxin-antitoxin system